MADGDRRVPSRTIDGYEYDAERFLTTVRQNGALVAQTFTSDEAGRLTIYATRAVTHPFVLPRGVSVIPDTIDEPDESAPLDLTVPLNTTLADAQGRGVIHGTILGSTTYLGGSPNSDTNWRIVGVR